VDSLKGRLLIEKNPQCLLMDIADRDIIVPILKLADSNSGL